jgi:hypothetical protein
MQRWDPLSERQLLLLQRVGDGDDLSGPDGVSLRTSARSLQSRRLVRISRRDGSWRAQITEGGRFYLDHGYHPDRPIEPPAQKGGAVKRTAPPQAAARPLVASPSRNPTVESAKQLIERLRSEGGTVTVEGPDEETRAVYRRTIHAAKQHKLVPDGFHLKHTGRARGDLIIRLTSDDAPDDTDWNRVRLNTRRVTSDPSLVFQALEKDPAGLQVTEASLPRALEFVRALAEQARLRGHRLGVNTKTRHPKLYLQVGGARRSVTLHEEYDEVPHVPTEQERRQLRRSPWVHVPETDKVASGRLRLEIARTTWTDDKRTTLEKRLSRIIRDVEVEVAADEEARQAAARAHQEYLAAEQRKAEEQRRQWQAALDQARPQAAEALRRQAFRAAYDAWTSASEIRGFCDALEAAASADDDPSIVDNRTHWIAWGRAAADRIDPTRDDADLAAKPFAITPGPDDLRPYIGDWSPHEPRREYRYERDQQKIDQARVQADTWHHGMRGRPNWWRNR